MSRSWTGGETAPRGRRPASSRVPLLAAAACAALLLPACRGDEGKPNQILPIRATIDLPDPEPLGPAVFFRQSVFDTDPDDDLVVLDVVLRTVGPLDFDVFNLEVHFDPGIVKVGGDPDDPPFSATPFGACNTCVRNCIPPTCPIPPCPPPLLCRSCDEVCASPNTIENPTQTPICLMNALDADATGTLVVGVSINHLSDCAASFTAPAGSDIKLTTLGFVAASIGTSAIELITDPNPMRHGDCEILMFDVDRGVPCDDRSASITATR